LHLLQDKGVQLVALEASSHGLDQNRLDGLDFDVTGFTNITRDHLDYHKTMEAYLAAKMHLFLDRTKQGGTVVLNADVPEYADMRTAIESAHPDLRVLSYGYAGKELRLIEQLPTADGQDVLLEIMGDRALVHINVYGDFQVMNILCALGMCIGIGAKVADLLALLPNLKAPAGRMECVGTMKNGAQVFVDYAHTPDAL